MGRPDFHPRAAAGGGLVWILLLLGPAPAYPLSPDEGNTIRVFEDVHVGVVNITNYAVAYDYFLTPVPTEASGTGSIIDKNGHVLTNNHVVANAKRLQVTLADGTHWPAKLVGRDPQTDLAVIRINATPDRLRPLPWGDSRKLRVGQKVLAIGNPFGLEQTLTTGIVSAVRKRLKIGDVEVADVIQTDAAINPGNSGGPLLDSEGRMVGINTAIFSPSGASAGIGFAIPVATARKVAAELISHGYVRYAYAGLELQTILPAAAKSLGLPVEKGSLIAKVVPGGPAAKAGLKGGDRYVEIGNLILLIGGDIITGIQGQSTDTAEQVISILRERKPGDTVQMSVVRGRKRIAVPLTLEERPRQ